MKTKQLLLIIGLAVSFMTINACGSKQTQTNSKEQSIAACCDKINGLYDKMKEEAEAFYPNTNMKVRNSEGDLYGLFNYYPTASVALTEAINHGSMIMDYLAPIKREENVLTCIQKIDGECYHIENYCSKGIKELETGGQYISASMKSNWISILNRIKNYSAEIREQVQLIRDLQ